MKRSPLGLDLYLWLTYRTFGPHAPDAAHLDAALPAVRRETRPGPPTKSPSDNFPQGLSTRAEENQDTRGRTCTTRTVKGALLLSPSPPVHRAVTTAPRGRRVSYSHPVSENSPKNQLFYGDNLDVLGRHVADESVDLVYLDPPFNSNANYNVLFAERDGTQAAAQIKAFEDTWRWDEGAARAYADVVEAGGRVSQAMQAFRTFIGENDMLAYLSMMAPRLVELRRVLKATGSLYLHCDPTASHYLKMLLDAVFGSQRFTNEIVWQRTYSHNMASAGFARQNDILFLYSKGSTFTFHPVYVAYGPAQMKRYKPDPDGRLYKAENLTFSTVNPSRQFEWRGARPPAHRSWGASEDQLEEWWAAGRIITKRDGSTPRLDGLKVYLDEMKGNPCGSNWSDIPRIPNTSAERMGYPTQKPEALLERILAASSNEGDVVLDPFCGCGTTVTAAQKLGRQWIGIDVTNLAITLIRHRLKDAYGDDIEETYEVVGEPVSVPDAEALAASDPYQFQWWALGLVGARPADGKKGADQGIDGRIYFHDGDTGKTKQIVLSVKAGKLHAPYVRDLRGVVEREQAAQGALLTLHTPTRAMRTEAASAGFYDSPWGQHPRVQILTVGELLAGKKLDAPPPRQTSRTYKRAPKARKKAGEQPGMFGDG